MITILVLVFLTLAILGAIALNNRRRNRKVADQFYNRLEWAVEPRKSAT